MRNKVGDSVTYNGTVYVNTSGRNSEPPNSGDWVPTSKLPTLAEVVAQGNIAPSSVRFYSINSNVELNPSATGGGASVRLNGNSDSNGTHLIGNSSGFDIKTFGTSIRKYIGGTLISTFTTTILEFFKPIKLTNTPDVTGDQTYTKSLVAKSDGTIGFENKESSGDSGDVTLNFNPFFTPDTGTIRKIGKIVNIAFDVYTDITDPNFNGSNIAQVPSGFEPSKDIIATASIIDNNDNAIIISIQVQSEGIINISSSDIFSERIYGATITYFTP